MIMVHGDDQGLSLPPKVAPIQVVIVPIYKNEEMKNIVISKANEIRDNIEKLGFRVHVDEREGISPGYKFNDWEMKGVPLRIELGPKDIEKESIVLAKRIEKEKTSISFNEISKISTILEEIQATMLKNAQEKAQENTFEISEYSEFKEKIERGGFIHAPWCGALECEEKIKEETGADIRVIPFNSENTTANCIFCKKTSQSIPIFARGY